MTRIVNARSALAAAAVIAVLAAGCGTATSSRQTTSAGTLNASLSGAGSTFIAPLMLEWINKYTHSVQTGVHVNYQGIGSGGGIEQFIAQKIDFGATDAFMKDEEITAVTKARTCGVLHIPVVFGAVVLAFNAPGLETLTLDGPTLASIFLGKIKTYDDPAIKALNPGATLPSKPIVVVHRSDGSGTTSIFTKYLSSISSEWKSKVGSGKTVQWQTGVGGQGNDGVAAAIQQNSGGLGYVELAYAIDNKLTTVTMKNAAGKAVAATVDSTTAAANNVQIPADLRFTVSNVGGDGYPIVGATWILAYECGYSAAKAAALKDFLKWDLNSGDVLARQLHYAPVSASLRSQALANVDRINSKS